MALRPHTTKPRECSCNGERLVDWDDRDRLVAITSSDGRRVDFAYDALNRRVKKTAAGVETVFVWDGEVLLHELSTKEGPITWMFEPGTFTPVAKMQGLRRYSIVADQVGAPCAAYDEWGMLAWQGVVDVFGRAEVDVATTAIPWRFPGQYEDSETGLVYNWFRVYDPDTGAYISKDPIGLHGGLNLWAYVEDPLSQMDARGLSSCKIHFGQRRIAPTFATINSKAHPGIVGRTLQDVAQDIRDGRISVDDILVQYFFDAKSGLYVAANNRGLAAISLAGKKPTLTDLVRPDPATLRRLEERPLRGYDLPGQKIPVTPGQNDLRVVYEVVIPT